MHATQATALVLLASAVTTSAWVTTHTRKKATDTETYYVSSLTVAETPGYVVPGVTTYPTEEPVPTTLEKRVASVSAVYVDAADMNARILAEEAVQEAKAGKGGDFEHMSDKEKEDAVLRGIEALAKSKGMIENDHAETPSDARALTNAVLGNAEHTSEDKYADMSAGTGTLRKILADSEHKPKIPAAVDAAVNSHKGAVNAILLKIGEMIRSMPPSPAEANKPAFQPQDEPFTDKTDEEEAKEKKKEEKEEKKEEKEEKENDE